MKKNFSTVDGLRNAIINVHKEQPNAVVLIKDSDVIALDELAKRECQTVVVVEKAARRERVLAVEYDGELHYFEKSNSKKRFLFHLQQQQ